jgi:hypothetical protein
VLMGEDGGQVLPTEPCGVLFSVRASPGQGKASEHDKRSKPIIG